MKLFRFGVLSAGLMGLWLIFSGHFDAFHIGLGMFSVGLVVSCSHSLFPTPEEVPSSGLNPEQLLKISWPHLILYPFEMMLNIIVANFRVAALIINPAMPIDPHIYRFETNLRTDAAKLMLGNSITVTPGTLTLDIHDQEFSIHALTPSLASSLFSGEDQNRVAKIFKDPIHKEINIITED